MKQNLFKGLIVATLCLANASHADFTFYAGGDNRCEHLPGHWSGSGKASNWVIGECIYHGFGTISPLDSSGHFTVDVHSDKDSGNFMCPEHSQKQFTGTCINGVAVIHTDYGNVTGDFLANSGTAKGNLAVAPGIRVEVSMQFSRDK